MSINLQKGQKIDLSKSSSGSALRRVMVGLGWDEVPQKRSFFGPKPQDIDCDAFAVLLGSDMRLLHHTNDLNECTVYFNHLEWPGGSIRHMGDNLTGAGDGDDEQIFVDLQNVPGDVCAIVFGVNIYEAFKRKQHFGMIRNAFIRVVDHERGVELCRFNLTDNYNDMTGLIAGVLVRANGGWEFSADGTGAKVESLLNIVAAFV